MGVYRDLHAVVVGGLDDRLELRLGELRVHAALGQRKHAARAGDLDEIGAILVALADRLAGVVGAVDHAFLGAGVALVLIGEPVGRITVATGGGERLADRENP